MPTPKNPHTTVTRRVDELRAGDHFSLGDGRAYTLFEDPVVERHAAVLRSVEGPSLIRKSYEVVVVRALAT